MAFNSSSSMGSAEVMTPIVNLTAPGGVLTYAPDAISVLKTDEGTVSPILRPSLDNIIFNMTGGPLLPMGTAPGFENDDFGVLVTGTPAGTGTGHGIPANWGAGRGNWNANNLKNVNVQILAQENSPPAAADTGSVQVFQINLLGSDLQIVFRNMGASTVPAMTVVLEYRHSISLN